MERIEAEKGLECCVVDSEREAVSLPLMIRAEARSEGQATAKRILLLR